MWNIYYNRLDNETNNILHFYTDMTSLSLDTSRLKLLVKHAFSQKYDVIYDVIPEANKFVDPVEYTRQTISFPMSGRSLLYLF